MQRTSHIVAVTLVSACAAAAHAQQCSLLDGIGTETSTLMDTGLSGVALDAGDLNNDGRPDIAAAGDRKVSVLVQTDFGFSIKDQIELSVPVLSPGVRDIAILDYDNDGDRDIVVTIDADTDGGSIRIMLNDGSGSFAAQPEIPLSFLPELLVAGDIDNNGLEDLVIIDPDGQELFVLRNQGGSFGTPESPGAFNVAQVQDIVLADFDSNGFLDILVVDDAEDAIIFLNEARFPGELRFGARTAPSFAAGNTIAGAAVGDLEGDGDLDIVVASFGLVGGAEGRIAVARTEVLGERNVSFESLETFSVPVSTNMPVEDVALMDPDRDGDLDIVVFYTDSTASWVYENTGAGGFVEAGQIPSSRNNEDVADVDLNNDGLRDIAYVATGSGPSAVSVLLNICENTPPCNDSDLAEPFSVLDLSDISRFIDGFVVGCD